MSLMIAQHNNACKASQGVMSVWLLECERIRRENEEIRDM